MVISMEVRLNIKIVLHLERSDLATVSSSLSASRSAAELEGAQARTADAGRVLKSGFKGGHVNIPYKTSLSIPPQT